MLHSLSDIEIAWLAGLMEGDGWFTLSLNNGGPSRLPRIGIAMLDRDVIERVTNLLNTTITTYLTKNKTKVMYSTTLSRRDDLEPLLKILHPHMGVRRKTQIDKLLAYYAEKDI